MKQRLQNANGFTFIELILVMSLTVLLIGAFSALFLYFFQSYSFSFDESFAVAQAQGGMTILIREIREIRSGENGSWPLVTTDDNAFVFYSDVTNDGRTDRVRYFLNGTTLQKGVIEPTGSPVTYPSENERVYTVATNVQNGTAPLFQYYNGDWPGDVINNPLGATNRIAQTRFITVSLAVDVNPTAGAKPYQLTSSAQLRNLKDNL